jgi:thioredoxin-related protein
MRLLLLINTFLFCASIWTPGWQLNFDQAKVEARQSHKLILLNFSGSDWCGPCIKLKKDVFESSEFQAFAADHIILVRADFPRLTKNQLDAHQTAHNEALAETYNKQGKFPFTVLLDANGRVLQTWEGYPKGITPTSFIADIQTVASAK